MSVHNSIGSISIDGGDIEYEALNLPTVRHEVTRVEVEHMILGIDPFVEEAKQLFLDKVYSCLDIDLDFDGCTEDIIIEVSLDFEKFLERPDETT